MRPTLIETRELVVVKHGLQVDQQGRDYVDAHLTPIAAALALFGEEYETLGLLHDIVEDTDTTLDELRSYGYDEEIVSGVDSMTRRVEPVTGRKEPYRDLILRSAAHRLGRRGKGVDGRWNILCNHELSLVDPRRAESLLHGRYLPARKVLLAADNLTGGELHAIDQVLHAHLERLSEASAAA